MKLTLNGAEVEVESRCSIEFLLKLHKFDTAAIAVAVNQEFVPRGRYREINLKENDDVEVVAPMQGG